MLATLAPALAYLALLPSALLLAQVSPGAEPWIDSLIKGGPFAIVVALVVTDKLGTHGERNRLRVENDALHGEIRDLNKDLRDTIAPLLKTTTDTLAHYIDTLERHDGGSAPRRRS